MSRPFTRQYLEKVRARYHKGCRDGEENDNGIKIGTSRARIGAQIASGAQGRARRCGAAGRRSVSLSGTRVWPRLEEPAYSDRTGPGETTGVRWGRLA